MPGKRHESSVGRRERFVRFASAGVILASICAPVAGQSFSIGANFTTITRSQTSVLSGILEPPDTMGAAGPNDFVEFNNGSFSIYNKNSSLVSQESDTTFWTSALGSNPGGLTDPRVLYDPLTQRWYASMVTTDQVTNNKVLIARSNSADPTQGFKAVSFSTLSNRFADFPALGMDANAVYLTTNNFNTSDTFRSMSIYSIPKADLDAATPSIARLSSHTALSPSTYGFTMQAATDYGPKLPTDPEPIISTSNLAFSQYKFVKLSGTSNSGATLGAVTTRTVQTTSDPTNSPQPGTSTTIDNGDDRFSSSAVQIGNFLYAVQNITVSGRSAVRWTIADATTFNVLQQGTIGDATLSYFYPSIAVNASGDVVVGFSGSSSTTFAGTYAVVGTSLGGAPGGTLSFGTPQPTKAGTDFYPDTRWGDYSAVTPDPADPGIFWAHQEYAANRFTSGGTTYGNWATQATEIIPTKTGERRWSNTAGGIFSAAANYFGAAAPAISDSVIFSRPGAAYNVAFSANAMTDRAIVRQGNVTWDLSGGSYTLTNSVSATPSVVVGEFQGTAALTLTGGALNTVNALIGAAAVGSGSVTAGANADWTNSGSLAVGTNGIGNLVVQSTGTVYIGTNLSVGAFGGVNVSGGTLRFDGYSRAAGGMVSIGAGTIQLAGNRTLDTDAAVADFFGGSPSIATGQTLAVEGAATISGAKPIAVGGGTLAANSLTLSSGSQLTTSQTSVVSAPVLAQAGSLIEAASGALTIGDATNINGFYSNGTLHVNASSVTLADADGALFDSTAHVTLGSGGNPGTLSSANGITLNAGGAISGEGTISTPNTLAATLANSGSIAGNSAAQPLTLSGYVTGTGTLDNVKLTGTYSPGAGPASVTLGAVDYEGALNIEISGTTPGTGFDQLNHTLNAAAAQLGGELDVSLLSGFVPTAGEMFQILTATGGVTGTFANTVLPALDGNLSWQVEYDVNSVTLAVIAPTLPGDYNGDGIVDAADYVIWRKTDGNNQAGYDAWRANFGNTLGRGAARVSAAIPEPATAMMLIICGLGVVPIRRHPAKCRGNFRG